MEELIPLFSKPVFLKNIDFNLKQTLSTIEKIEFEESNPKIESDKSYASNDKYILEHKELKTLKTILTKELNLYVKNHMHYVNNFEITTSWLTKIDQGADSVLHNHNNSMLSGVLYLKVNKKSGRIRFESFADARYLPQISKYTVFNSLDYYFEPSDKLLIIFPSEMFHQVEQNKSNITRYSLAFNAIPKGLVGDRTTDSHLYV